jgi:hypothetical protein
VRPFVCVTLEPGRSAWPLGVTSLFDLPFIVYHLIELEARRPGWAMRAVAPVIRPADAGLPKPTQPQPWQLHRLNVSQAVNSLR